MHFVHIDYSYEGASTILHQSVSSEEAEQLSKTRWAAINVWRPLNHAVTREPLSVCDAESVAEEDLCGVCSTSQGRSFETWVLKYSPNHKWYYMSQQTPDDVLIIKIYDSKKDGRARRTPHSAFYAPNEYGPARNSIETRCLVFWEDQDAE